MCNRIHSVFLLLISLLSGVAHSDDDTQRTRWVFDKVSEHDIFGKHNSDIINHLNMIYNKSILNVEGNKLIITNDFLEKRNVCSTEYIKLKKSAISYFMSTKVASMYSMLFKNENIQFPEDIYEITSLFPGKECPAPYDEIVKTGSNLFITDQSYIVFYKQSDVIAPQDNTLHPKNNWDKYCHNENVGRQFDSASKYICVFDNMDVKESYGKFISFDKNISGNLKNNPPDNNDSYKINGGSVVYKWINKDKLSISVVMDSETTNYYFDKDNTGTKLYVLFDTQY
ncbi:hypothetical protein [Kosakonia sp. YIM B13611]|uniref:hypothetical protein n=1 Tax=unclassified Kosakonia TaxID=2632876 RepID=UPI0036BD6074